MIQFSIQLNGNINIDYNKHKNNFYGGSEKIKKIINIDNINIKRSASLLIETTN